MFETRITSHNRDSRLETVLFKWRTPSSNPVSYPEYYAPSDPFYTSSFEDEYEEIWGDWHGKGRQWKPVQHYKRRTSPESVAGAFTHLIDNGIEFHNYRVGEHKDPYWGYRGVYGDAGAPFIGLPALYNKLGEGNFIPPPSQLDQLLQRSLDHMLPLIKAELSIINSIIELKDFKSLSSTVSNVTSFLARTFARVKLSRQAVAKRFAGTLRGLLHSTSDGYLQAQFNILPLLSDIVGIHAALFRTQARINDLVTRAGRVQNKHFAYKYEEAPDSYHPNGIGYFIMPGIVPGLHDIASTIARRIVVSEPTVFHAQIRYNYNYNGYQVAHAQLLGLLDAMGVNLNPQIIWNAIPWTFVVDWVIGVSRWLDQFKHLSLEPTINILSYLWSVRRERRVFITTENSPIDSVQFGEFVYPSRYPVLRNTLPGVHETSYRRDVSIPTISSILSSGLTLKEVSLGAALVITRKFNPKRAKRWKMKL